jgi:hypothetical protein
MISTFCGSPPLSFRPLLRMAEGLCCSLYRWCSFLYPFVSKEASLKHLSFHHPTANTCIGRYSAVLVHLLVYLFLYLYVCDSTIRYNTLTIRRLQSNERHFTTLPLRHGCSLFVAPSIGLLLDASLPYAGFTCRIGS